MRELRRIAKELDLLDAQHDRKVYAEIAKTYAIARVCLASQDAWLELCRERYWDGRRIKPKVEKRDEAFRFVAQLLVRSKPNPERKRSAYLYRYAMAELRARKVKPADALKVIGDTKRGLSGLQEAYVARARAKAGDASKTPDRARDGVGREPEKPTSARVETSKHAAANANAKSSSKTTRPASKAVNQVPNWRVLDHTIVPASPGYSPVSKTGQTLILTKKNGEQVIISFGAFKPRDRSARKAL